MEVIEVIDDLIIIEVGDAIFPEWGGIRGTLSNQEDLQTALNQKSNVGHIHTSLVPYELVDEDLNDVLPDDTTFYYAGDPNTCIHTPFQTGTAFGLLVYRNSSGYRIQIAASSGGVMASRVYRGSVWSNWLTWVLDGYSASAVDTLLSYKANINDLGALAVKDKADWDSDIENIPQTFPPSSHDHDSRYYTETEVDSMVYGFGVKITME